ncbi:MAG: Nif3-like dinuclear metal center hexameric protein, partial [Gemmatimonadota bacterium]
MLAELGEVADWLDAYLRIGDIEDYPGALNGLQVESRGPIGKVGAATDAAQATIDAAADAGCDLLLVHHGLFWGDPAPVTGAAYRRLRRLFEADMALYAAHLPLDVHEEVGNNALLAGALGLTVDGRFGRYRSLEGIGVLASLDLAREHLLGRVADECGTEPQLIPGGPVRVRRVAIVTGAAGSLIGDAVEAGADTLVTGEGAHHTYHEALEAGINVIYA